MGGDLRIFHGAFYGILTLSAICVGNLEHSFTFHTCSLFEILSERELIEYIRIMRPGVRQALGVS